MVGHLRYSDQVTRSWVILDSFWWSEHYTTKATDLNTESSFSVVHNPKGAEVFLSRFENLDYSFSPCATQS